MNLLTHRPLLLRAALLLCLLALPGLIPEAYGRDPHLPKDIPSWTLYSHWDQEKTLSYLKRHPRRPWKPSWQWKTLQLRLYTTSRHTWDAAHVSLVQRLTDWYYAPCRIRFRWTAPRWLRPGQLQRGGHLRFRIRRRDVPGWRRGETLVFLTKTAKTPLRGSKKAVSLLGLSFRVALRQRGKRTLRVPAVWVRSSLLFTTLAHELGHRLGLSHVRRRHNLMLTGSGVRGSLDLLFTSLTGYFDPSQFHFQKSQCQKMRRRWNRFTRRAIRGPDFITEKLLPCKECLECSTALCAINEPFRCLT